MQKYYSMAIYIRNQTTPTQADLYHQFDLPGTPITPLEPERMREVVTSNLVGASQGLAQANRPATDMFFLVLSLDPATSAWTSSKVIQATDSAAIAALN